jgi:hypothetical protein
VRPLSCPVVVITWFLYFERGGEAKDSLFGIDQIVVLPLDVVASDGDRDVSWQPRADNLVQSITTDLRDDSQTSPSFLSLYSEVHILFFHG